MSQTFYKLLEENPVPVLELDQVVEGTVIGIHGAEVYVDLSPYGTGIIYGKEYFSARDIIRNLNAGDAIKAKVVELENEDGYIELSLREAKKALAWEEAEEAFRKGETIELVVKEANKGGLMLDWHGMLGFLPASQLNAEHYPRVESGDAREIANQLSKLIGQKLAVTILTVNPKEGKLIFSEKGEKTKREKKIPSKYKVGDVVEGEVTGIVDFGIFIKIEDGVEGLVHISEIAWSLVDNPRTLYKVGDTVKAKIIDVQEGKISFSIKALTENPWKRVEGKYKVGQKVEGVVIKHNKHGALVSIEEGIAGLVHISEFESERELKDTLKLGQSYPFVITSFDPKNQKLTLSYSQVQKENKEKEETE